MSSRYTYCLIKGCIMYKTESLYKFGAEHGANASGLAGCFTRRNFSSSGFFPVWRLDKKTGEKTEYPYQEYMAKTSRTFDYVLEKDGKRYKTDSLIKFAKKHNLRSSHQLSRLFSDPVNHKIGKGFRAISRTNHKTGITEVYT